MNIFISWSKNRSRLVAELLHNWLQKVIQRSVPWVSSHDINAGSQWFASIGNQLADTITGIVCLTKENVDNPWIMYETGALVKGLSEARVFTLLVDLKDTDVSSSSPLFAFNHTNAADRESMRKMVRNINGMLAIGSQLSEGILNEVFETYWVQYKDAFDKIIAETENVKVEANGEPEGPMNVMPELLETLKALNLRLTKIEQRSASDEIPFVDRTISARDTWYEHKLTDGRTEKRRVTKLPDGRFYVERQRTRPLIELIEKEMDRDEWREIKRKELSQDEGET